MRAAAFRLQSARSPFPGPPRRMKGRRHVGLGTAMSSRQRRSTGRRPSASPSDGQRWPVGHAGGPDWTSVILNWRMGHPWREQRRPGGRANVADLHAVRMLMSQWQPGGCAGVLSSATVGQRQPSRCAGTTGPPYWTRKPANRTTIGRSGWRRSGLVQTSTDRFLAVQRRPDGRAGGVERPGQWPSPLPDLPQDGYIPVPAEPVHPVRHFGVAT